MTEIKWEEPVQLRGRGARNDYSEIARQLKKNPGKWAVVAERGSSTHVSRIKQGVFEAFRPAGAFESVSNAIPGEPPHVRKVFARYIGEAENV